jgi:hypothetical protein
VVPSRNHWQALPKVIECLRSAGLPVFIIDDDRDEPAAGNIAALHDPNADVRVIRLPLNRGKGGR